jgi:hypothetical protein
MNVSDDILREGDPRRAKLDKHQAEIARLKGEIAAIEKGWLTPADVRESLARCLDRALAGPSGFHSFADFAAPEGEFHRHRWPDSPTWGSLAFLFGGRDELVNRITAHLERNRKGAPGLPLAERPEAIARLREKLEAVERKEELEVIRLEAEGATILRREDCNVDLILDIHRGLGSEKPESVQDVPAEAINLV